MKKLLILTKMLIIFSFANAQKFGTYSGKIGVNKLATITTRIESQNNVITGDYSYGNFYGKFINAVLIGNKLSCDWVESATSKGRFEAIFNKDFSEFIGIWYYGDNKYGGAWTGKK